MRGMETLMSIEQMAARFRCTTDQIRAQFKRNADDLAAMAAVAERKGRKVNGYTAAELRAKSAKMAARAAE